MTATEAIDLGHLRTWVGREERAKERITSGLAERYHATFDMAGDAPGEGEVVPRLIHWCVAQPAAPTARLGPDGHPEQGRFLPPVALPRRMWAGGEVMFTADLHVGDTVRRTSRIADVALKEGRTGPLCFVTVEHAFHVDGTLRVRERQDIILTSQAFR